MSYGIELKNDFGDRVLNSGGLLFEKASGTMVFVDDGVLPYPSHPNYTDDHLDVTNRDTTVLRAQGVTKITAAHASTGGNYTVYNDTDGGSFNNNSYTSGSTLQVNSNSYAVSYQPRNSGYSFKVNHNRIRYAVPNTADTSVEYEAFFKIPSQGLHNWSEMYNPYNKLFDANCKGIHLAATASHSLTSGIQYVIAGTEKPNLSSDTYGMQVYDGDGNIHYDTRYETSALAIKDYVNITAAQFQDCIENGTTYNFTLRQPISNAYVGGGVQGNYKNQSGGGNHYMWRPTFKMTSTTNLRMYRTQYRFSASGSLYSATFSNYNDCLLTLLDY